MSIKLISLHIAEIREIMIKNDVSEYLSRIIITILEMGDFSAGKARIEVRNYFLLLFYVPIWIEFEQKLVKYHTDLTILNDSAYSSCLHFAL